VTTVATNGFDDDVTLSLAGLPGAAGSSTFAPPVVSGSATSQLTIATSPTAAPGSYSLTITGTSGSLTHSVPMTLVVSGDFAVTASPPQITIKHGKTATYSVSLSPVDGFSGKVHLSATGIPPRATYWFSHAWVRVPGTSKLKVKTYPVTARGTRTITITAHRGTLTHEVTVTLTVT
jgi:uncharacterized membrane protein